MNTTLKIRLIAAALAAVATSSMLMGLVWLGQPAGDTVNQLAQQPPPVVVVASTGVP